MPTHYGGSGKKKPMKKKKTGMKPMTKEQHDRFLKAEKDGLITKKQHNSLPPQLLEAIIKSKMKKK
tara:strand:- start:2153 stop:2350 length:198 start_codon:yes stop_codon:yes gene_type:complete